MSATREETHAEVGIGGECCSALPLYNALLMGFFFLRDLPLEA